MNKSRNHFFADRIILGVQGNTRVLSFEGFDWEVETTTAHEKRFVVCDYKKLGAEVERSKALNLLPFVIVEPSAQGKKLAAALKKTSTAVVFYDRSGLPVIQSLTAGGITHRNYVNAIMGQPDGTIDHIPPFPIVKAIGESMFQRLPRNDYLQPPHVIHLQDLARAPKGFEAQYIWKPFPAGWLENVPGTQTLRGGGVLQNLMAVNLPDDMVIVGKKGFEERLASLVPESGIEVTAPIPATRHAPRAKMISPKVPEKSSRRRPSSGSRPRPR